MKAINFKYIITGWLLAGTLGACSDHDSPDDSGHAVPEGMVEVQPVLPGMFAGIPRDPADNDPATRAYPSNDATNELLSDTVKTKPEPLPEGSTVWLIAWDLNKLKKNSYVVYTGLDENNNRQSYLVPCQVNDDGELINMEGTPLYLTENKKYYFFAVSPARKLDEEMFKNKQVGFQIKNGEYVYATDCRYTATTPEEILVRSNSAGKEAVQRIHLKPMMHQTAQLRFRIRKGHGVHDLDIQPSGIQISGLQDDTPEPLVINNIKVGDENGICWHMSMTQSDEPIVLQHGDKQDSFRCYNYEISDDEIVTINLPIIPMRSISNPVIVTFRLKINGVPSSFEMMLNEKDFKAGYFYGYRGEVSVEEGVSIITWQFVSWDTDVELPITPRTSPPTPNKVITPPSTRGSGF